MDRGRSRLPVGRLHLEALRMIGARHRNRSGEARSTATSSGALQGRGALGYKQAAPGALNPLTLERETCTRCNGPAPRGLARGWAGSGSPNLPPVRSRLSHPAIEYRTASSPGSARRFPPAAGRKRDDARSSDRLLSILTVSLARFACTARYNEVHRVLMKISGFAASNAQKPIPAPELSPISDGPVSVEVRSGETCPSNPLVVAAWAISGGEAAGPRYRADRLYAG